MIRYGVVHHPSRAHLLERLAALSPVVFTDPDPDGQPLAWRTYRHALASFPDDASHLVLLQDDAIPVPGFAAACVRAINARPDDPIVLFVSGQARRNGSLLLDACSRDEPFFTLSQQDWIPVVAVIWPRDVAARFLAWADLRFPQGGKRRADDAIVGSWSRDGRQRFLGTVPSLVEHPDDEPSLVGARSNSSMRRALCLADHGDEFRP